MIFIHNHNAMGIQLEDKIQCLAYLVLVVHVKITFGFDVDQTFQSTSTSKVK